jgi:hypothetical protein
MATLFPSSLKSPSYEGDGIGADRRLHQGAAVIRHDRPQTGWSRWEWLRPPAGNAPRELPCASPCKPAGTEVRFSSKVVSRVP